MTPPTSRDTQVLERRFLTAGEVIISEGEAGANAFLIQSGTVRIFSKHNGKKIVLGTLGPGDIFGEMSLIRDMPRSASVEAITDCLVIIITRPVLKEKLEKSDATVRAILAMMIKRVQSGNDSLANKRPTLEDLQENLVLLYEEVMSTLPIDRKPFFRDEMLPLIEDITDRMKKFKV